MQNIHMKYFYI